MRRAWSAVAVALLVGLSETVSAQTVFRGGVELVEIDVNVVDNHDQPLPDLAMGEFTVKVDGKPRRVVSAEYIASAAPASGRASTASYRSSAPTSPQPRSNESYSANDGRGRGRLIVLAVDRESIAFGEGAGVLKAAADFLTRLAPEDKVAFLAIPQTGPMIDFTANREVIRDALMRSLGVGQRARRQVSMGVYEAIAIALRSDPVTEESVMTRLCPNSTRAPRVGADGRPVMDATRTLQDRCRMEVRAQALGISSEIAERTNASLRTLRNVLDGLRRIDAPASFVWISDGLVTESVGGGDLADLGRLAGRARATINVLMVDSLGGNIIEADRSPSARQDRDLERNGLMNLAASTRGVLYNVGANAAGAFQRIEGAISAYYLLAIDAIPDDHDGKSHQIDVKVRRRGAQVRARREFQMLTDQQAASQNPRDRVLDLLRSPMNVNDLPLRVATYGYQDASTGQVKLLVAAEAERPAGTEPAPVQVSVGLLVQDDQGKQVGSQLQQAALTPVTTPSGQVLEYATAVSVDPGHYTVRLAMVDEAGRRGSVSRDITAFQMAELPFAVSDLMLTDAKEAAGGGIHPVVEPRLKDGRLGAYLEMYSNEPGFLDEVIVDVEVARGESEDAIASARARFGTGEGTGRTLAVADVEVGSLSPDIYVARAVVRRGAETIGRLDRPFRITAMGPQSRAVPPLLTLMEPPRFDPASTLTPQVLGFFLDLTEKRYPGMRREIIQVRRGHLENLARVAFDRGDQMGAAFLRGLELLSTGQLNPAALQFAAALNMAPEFSPAAFYLGVCYAAAGRHADAATMWRRALLVETRLPVQYAALGDALLQAGEPDQAVVVLRQALSTWPGDDGLRRRLALAYGAQSQFGQVLPQIEPYLARHSEDHEALLMALHALFAAHLAGRPLTSEAGDRAKARDYARAYMALAGPQAKLVTTWVAVLETAPDRGGTSASGQPVEP